MKMERLSQDKIRIFLTFDDLSERGIPKDDMLQESMKLRALFMEMMDQAYAELGFDPSGPLAVEVFSLPAQGMVVIVTSGKLSFHHNRHEEGYDEAEADEVYEMEVMLEQSDLISYAFRDFEDVLGAIQLIEPILSSGGSLYKYREKWMLQFEEVNLEEDKYSTLIAILSEYGEATSVTQAVVQEYGTTVISDQAIEVLIQHFK
ncbi:genetic competence negative regulator [Paenibacillus sp. N1-5-1-14]|uniref:genetic competence negative regulator n=1 Tax=Paenibacillus radicibacter TaxID=2972488 RepID=UPI0021597DCC|nr:genetic competence negative regulator [Paenibacillus radicibacter]MCR8642322.1 genetic competence negative regulator [Paenibacillus radicibacter]